VVQLLRHLSTDASMSVVMSLPSVALTWTLVSYSTRTARSGGILPLHVTYKVPSVLSIMGLTRLNIINTLPGVARPTSRLTLPISKLNWVNHTHILSNISTARVITKQIPTHVCSGTIILTKSGMQRNIRNFVILESSQFVQP